MFQQIVNLKDKADKERQELLAGQLKPAPSIKPEKTIKPSVEKESPSKNYNLSQKAQAIDRVFAESDEKIKRPDLQKISRPNFKVRGPMPNWVKNIIIIILLLAVGTSTFLFYRNYKEEKNDINAMVNEAKWYKVELVNGNSFYGKISDIKADPVVLSNVYYDYDQMNNEDAKDDTALLEKEDSGNLRLVKRGKEAHGPDGTLDIVRAQIVFMEPLADDSKVLKAILENEK